MTDERYDLDLRSGVTLAWFCWSPDRALNPQYAGIPNIDKLGAIIRHLSPRALNGCCACAIYFDTPEARRVLTGDRHFWQVLSWDPLTISPSVLCRGRNTDGAECGFHGFIRDGRWVSA